MGFFSKLFETFYDWLREHEVEEEEEAGSPKLIDFMLKKKEITVEQYLEYMGKTKYEVRIIEFMKKHPGATLEEARGHE